MIHRKCLGLQPQCLVNVRNHKSLKVKIVSPRLLPMSIPYGARTKNKKTKKSTQHAALDLNRSEMLCDSVYQPLNFAVVMTASSMFCSCSKLIM